MKWRDPTFLYTQPITSEHCWSSCCIGGTYIDKQPLVQICNHTAGKDNNLLLKQNGHILR